MKLWLSPASWSICGYFHDLYKIDWLLYFILTPYSENAQMETPREW